MDNIPGIDMERKGRILVGRKMSSLMRIENKKGVGLSGAAARTKFLMEKCAKNI